MDSKPVNALGRMVRRLSPGRKGTLAILGGTASGQLLALLAAPLLTRLYEPSSFGLFTVLASIVAIVGTVAALRFELAVPLPKEERDAHGLAALGLVSTAATFLVTSAIVAIAGSRLAGAFGEPQLMPWLWLVPVTAALMGAYLLLNQLAIRHHRYGAIGRRNILQSAALVATQVALGFTDLKAGGLILGLTVGHGTSTTSLIAGSGLLSPEARDGRRRGSLRRLAKRYRRFPLVLAPSGLLNVLGLQLPVVLIAYWYGSEVAGWMGLSQRVLSLPVTLIGTAIAQVYLGELARAAHNDLARARRLFYLVSKRLVLIAIAIGVAVVALGPPIFELVFGSQWVTSGTYAQALAFGLTAQLVAVPVSQTLIVFERQGLQLAWDSSRLVLLVGVLSACHLLGASATTALWAFGVGSGCAYVGSWFLSRHIINGSRPPSSSRQHAHEPPIADGE